MDPRILLALLISNLAAAKSANHTTEQASADDLLKTLLNHDCDSCAARESCKEIPEPYQFANFGEAEAHIRAAMAVKPGDGIFINTSGDSLPGVVIKVDLPHVDALVWTKERGIVGATVGLDVFRIVEKK